MPIRYPNGQPYSRSPKQGQAKKPLPADTYSGRGMTLEQDIDEANLYYLSQQRAVVHKNRHRYKLSKLITQNEVQLSSVRLILSKLQRQIIMAFTEAPISISKQKKQKTKRRSR